MDEATLRQWFEVQESPMGYLLIGLFAALEYLCPPLPGDTLCLFAIFLACTSNWSKPLVYLSLNLGAIVGGWLDYEAGRFWERRGGTLPSWLRGGHTEIAITRAVQGFAKYGFVLLIANRFIPSFRAVFFVAAGRANLPRWKMLLGGTLSAMLWNLLLLGLASYIAHDWENLSALVQRHGTFALVGITLIFLLWLRRALSSAPQT